MAFRPTRANLGLISSTRRFLTAGNRVPLSLHVRSQGLNPPPIIQHVRIRKPPLTRRAKLIRRLFYASLIGYFFKLGAVRLLDELDDEDEEDFEKYGSNVEDPEDEDEEFDDGIRLFPFLPIEQLPGQPYAHNSPEVQRFMKISGDDELKKRIVGTMVKDIARAWVTRNPKYGDWISLRSEVKIKFPARGPPIFYRKGIELTADGALEIRPRAVDPYTAALQAQVFYPVAFAKSIWAFIKVASIREVRPFAEKIGFDIALTPEEFHLFSEAEHMKKANRVLDHYSGNGAQSTQDSHKSKQSFPDGANMPNATDSSKVTAAAKQSKTTQDLDLAGDTWLWLRQSDRFQIPFQALLWQFRKLYRPPKETPPHGSVRLVGPMMLETDKAYIQIWVTGTWDPATGKYHSPSTFIEVKSLELKASA